MPAHWIRSAAMSVIAIAASVAAAEPPAADKQDSSGVVVTGQTPPKTDAAGKITDPKHPDFVRCRSEPVLNSRAQRVRVCRTNKEWATAARDGNRRTEELLNSGRPLQPTP